uniref:Auxin-responsive protein n=1 Tax=Tanacetum cinerariifolium TaxID=118510 RepID=A0A699IMX7_TANCI|nr:auxin-responsive protein IAA9-like [Tanacetum cinerariifolium]
MMTSQLLGVKDTPGLMTERNYLGLSDCSSVDSSNVSGLSEVNKSSLGLKATELRLGLPGSRSPDRDPESLTSSDKLEEKPLFHFLPSSPKWWCLDIKGSAMESDSLKSLGQGKFSSNSNVNGIALSEASKMAQVTSGTKLNKVNSSNTPAAKAQVVGWPPVRSFRKNILATSSKNNDEVDGKPGPGALFVKVSMDGAPYLRKVDLRGYSTYQQLSSALEKMFSCFTIGQCGSQGGSGRVSLSESKLRDLLHGSEYVLTYEDKDGDWMLVGDVPWDMFISSCKRLKIMKGSDAIGLAPRATEKSKNRN